MAEPAGPHRIGAGATGPAALSLPRTEGRIIGLGSLAARSLAASRLTRCGWNGRWRLRPRRVAVVSSQGRRRSEGLLRAYFPKSTDLAVHTEGHIALVQAELNLSPRKVLGWDSPADVDWNPPITEQARRWGQFR